MDLGISQNTQQSKINKYVNPKNLILIILLYVINIQWMIDLFNLPAAITRIDAILALLLIFWQFKKIFYYLLNNKLIMLFFLFYTATNFIGILLNGFSFAYIIWTFFKSYIFFFYLIACIVNLSKNEYIGIMEILCKLHILNCILCLYQYFVLGLQSDYLGGIFGIRQGCNGYQNIYGIVICCYLMYRYLNGEKINRLFIYLFSFLIIAAATDIIGFFCVIFLCFFLMLVFMEDKKRKRYLFEILFLCVVAGVAVFRIIYKERFEYFTNISNWLKYMGFGKNNDGGVYGVSRTNPFRQINEKYFKGDLLKELFGFGFGNCSQAESLKIFQSPFYLKNRDFQYYWFSTAYTYMETGFFGIVSYLILELIFLFKSIWNYFKAKNKNLGIYCLMLSVAYVFIFFYNQSLMISPAYIFYFSLVAIFIEK